MKTHHQSSAYWSMTSEELEKIHQFIGDLLKLKRDSKEIFHSVKTSSFDEKKENVFHEELTLNEGEVLIKEAFNKVSRRPLLGPPKPGSLREVVHEVLLNEGKAMRRADIIETVGKQTGNKLNPRFVFKVSKIIANAYDPYIQKVSRGFYGYAR